MVAAMALTDCPAICMARTFSRSRMMRLRPSIFPSRFARRRPATTRSDRTRMLLLRDGCQDGNDGVAEHACRVEVLLCKALPGDSITIQPLQVFQRLQCTLSAESIQRPEQHEIEAF